MSDEIAKYEVMFIIMVFLFVLFIRVLIAIFTRAKAKSKGYGTAVWFFGGLFFGFIALLVIDALPDRCLDRLIKIPEALAALSAAGTSDVAQEDRDNMRTALLEAYDDIKYL